LVEKNERTKEQIRVRDEKRKLAELRMIEERAQSAIVRPQMRFGRRHVSQRQWNLPSLKPPKAPKK